MSIEKDLTPSIGDYAHTTANAAISMIPLLGGSIAAFFNTIIAPPLEKRRDKWLIELYKELIQIKDKLEGFSIEELSKNDLFISIITQSTQIALKNHQDEKLQALRNAVLNTAVTTSFEETEQFIFLSLIDDLSIWHLKVLDYFIDPNQWFIKNSKTKPSIFAGSAIIGLTAAYNELKGKNEFINMITRDLYNKGLLTNSDSLAGLMQESGIFSSRITDFGKRFLSYISTPELLNQP